MRGVTVRSVLRSRHVRESRAARSRVLLIVPVKAADDMVDAEVNAEAVVDAVERMPTGGVL